MEAYFNGHRSTNRPSHHAPSRFISQEPGIGLARRQTHRVGQLQHEQGPRHPAPVLVGHDMRLRALRELRGVRRTRQYLLHIQVSPSRLHCRPSTVLQRIKSLCSLPMPFQCFMGTAKAFRLRGFLPFFVFNESQAVEGSSEGYMRGLGGHAEGKRDGKREKRKKRAWHFSFFSSRDREYDVIRLCVLAQLRQKQLIKATHEAHGKAHGALLIGLIDLRGSLLNLGRLRDTLKDNLSALTT